MDFGDQPFGMGMLAAHSRWPIVNSQASREWFHKPMIVGKKSFGHENLDQVCSFWLRPPTAFLPPFERQLRKFKVEATSENHDFVASSVMFSQLRRFTMSREVPSNNLPVLFQPSPLTSSLQTATMELIFAHIVKINNMSEPYELVETDEFAITWTLIGEPHRADARLEKLLHLIATKPESFYVQEYPNTRIAVETDKEGSIGVSFRIISDRQIELLRTQIKTPTN